MVKKKATFVLLALLMAACWTFVEVVKIRPEVTALDVFGENQFLFFAGFLIWPVYLKQLFSFVDFDLFGIAAIITLIIAFCMASYSIATAKKRFWLQLTLVFILSLVLNFWLWWSNCMLLL